MNTTTIFRFVLLFEILWGAHAWFTWWIDNSRILQYAFYIIIAIIAYNYKNKKRIRLNSSPTIILSMFCYIMGVMFFNRFSIPSLASVFLLLYTIWVTLSDRENVKGHIKFICKGLAIIFIPGIILFLGKGFIPPVGAVIQKGTFEDYVFINQVFLIHRIDGWDSEAANRFHSIFLEPGFIGSMLSFLLFAIKYDFSKWYTKTLLVAQLVSLSLAGYILTFIGYILYLLSEGKSLKKIILLGAIIPFVYITALEYNGGNNYINNAIISRLQYDEEKGISGNNRTGDGTEFYYNQAVENGDIWMGLGAERVKQINGGSSEAAGYDTNIRGAGYKVYFVIRGVISAIFFFLFYFFTAIGCCKKKTTRLIAPILVIITFLPQSTPQSTAWIYPFILGVLNYNFPKEERRKK